MTMATADRIDAKRPPRAGQLPRFSTGCRRKIWRRNRPCWAACCSTRRCATTWPWILRPTTSTPTPTRSSTGHLLAMHDEGKRIDTTLLVERLRQAGDFEAVGGAAYLAEVLQSVPYAANAMYYAEIVRDKATLRALIHASTEILRDAWDPGSTPANSVNQAEEKIFAVHDRRSTTR